MSIIAGIFPDKGTIIRLTFHCRSGNSFKVNPLQIGASGFLKGIEPKNELLHFTSEVIKFGDNRIIFINDRRQQVHSLFLEPGEKIIGLQSLVLYPDGSTWEGLISENAFAIKAMIWSPKLADHINPEKGTSPWQGKYDWTTVPTATLFTLTDALTSCFHQDHSCCEPCK